MSKVQVLDKNGKKIDDITLPKNIFSYPEKDHLLYEAIVNYRANQRRGTASTKTTSEVRGGGRKPWRQKGTGRARAGSIRSPLWKKGGVTFGPKPRDYSYKIPKKARRNALKSALSKKLAENHFIICESLDLDQVKTKEGVRLLENFKLGSVLVVDSHENKNLFLSLRNLQNVKLVNYQQLNAYDVLTYENILFSKKAFTSFVEMIK